LGGIAVLGLGVGYALACCLAEAGYEVTGVDLDPHVLASPRRDRSVDELLNIAGARISSNLKLTTDYSELRGKDVVIVCVSTGDERKLVLGSVEHAIRSTIHTLRDATHNPLILVYSTLPYGGSKRIKEIFEEEGVEIDEKISYCYMPLMVAEGTYAYDFVNPPFVVFGAYSKSVAERARDFYVDFIKRSCLFNGKLPPIYISTPEVAELAKLVANAFLSTKMSFANMVGELCEKLSIDGNIVMDIVGSDPGIGRKHLKPGFAFSGVCFPRD